MARKKRKVPQTSRLLICGTISLLCIIYGLTMLPSYIIQIYNLKQEEASLKEDLTNLQAKEKTLKTQIEKLKDKEYLAKYARENYQYSKDGELVFQMKEVKQPAEKKPKKINIDPNYFWIAGGIISFFVVVKALFLLKKKH